MKQLNRLAACCGAVLLLSFTAFSQDTGQKIRISQGRTSSGLYDVGGAPADGTSPAVFPVNSATPLTFESVDATPATVGNSLCSGSTDGFCGWYKAFWIFGDGNYIHFPDNLSELDAPSRTVSDYRYALAGNYQPVVYLTEKYHNTKPPEEARATVNVGAAGASGTYVETTRRFAAAPDRKIDIDYNHTPRVDYPLNFVLSYRKNEPANTVLFYYNSLISSGTYTPTELFSYTRNEATSYQGSGYGPVNQDALTSGRTTQGGGGNILDQLNSKFKSRLIYSVNDFPGTFPEAMTELRVFPVFKTKNLASMPAGLLSESPVTRFPAFAAILIGPDPLSKSDPAFDRLVKNAVSLLGPDIPSDLSLGGNTPQYIRGIELMNVAMETSHDPNSLIVTDIRDLGNGKFRVSFELSICNKGQGVENSPSIRFNDLTGGNFGAKPVFGSLGGGVNLSWTGGGGASWTATLAGFSIPGVPANHDPSCRSLTFTIDTDAAGVARLYQENPRALETCVDFSAGVGECSQNDALKPGAFQQDGKYPPLSDERGTGGGHCDWLLISLISAIILLILWFLIRR